MTNQEIAELEIKWDRLMRKVSDAEVEAESVLEELWPVGAYARTLDGLMVEIVGVASYNSLYAVDISSGEDGAFIIDQYDLTRVEDTKEASTENAKSVYENFLLLNPSERKRFFMLLTE